MSLEPKQKDLLDANIRRTVALAALKDIQRKLKNEAQEESRAQRRGGRAFGLLLIVASILVAYGLGHALFEHIATGIPSNASLSTEALKASSYTAFAAAGFALGAYFCIWFPRFNRSFATLAIASTVFAPLLVAVLYFSIVRVSGCASGDDADRRGDFDEAVKQFGSCLRHPNLSQAARATTLQSRAEAYFRTQHYDSAVADFEAAFKIRPPASAHEWTRYGVFLRYTGRHGDSLEALTHAEQYSQPQSDGYVQFQKGRSLASLGRHDEAVAAFTAVVSRAPSHPWAYWDRGLSYEALGKQALARNDFERCAALLSSRPDFPVDATTALLSKVQAKLRQDQRQNR